MSLKVTFEEPENLEAYHANGKWHVCMHGKSMFFKNTVKIVIDEIELPETEEAKNLAINIVQEKLYKS